MVVFRTIGAELVITSIIQITAIRQSFVVGPAAAIAAANILDKLAAVLAPLFRLRGWDGVSRVGFQSFVPSPTRTTILALVLRLKIFRILLHLVCLRIHPIQGPQATLEMLIDVIEPLIPALHTMKMQTDIREAKSAPEPNLVISADEVLMNLGFARQGRLNVMNLLEVVFHILSIPEDATTTGRIRAERGVFVAFE